jgi:hypothetical protein
VLRFWHRSGCLFVGGLLLAVVVGPVLTRAGPFRPPDVQYFAAAFVTIGGPNVRFQRTQPDEPNWAKSLELAAHLCGVRVSTPALAEHMQRKG